MSILLLNATSLAKPNAVQLLETELLQSHCDAALITESWFNSNHDDTILMIPGYNLFRRDRSCGKGGGVCAYIQSHVNCSVFVPNANNITRPEKPEILWLECVHNNYHHYIACCYHPPKPKYNPSVFVDLLTSDIDYINSSCDADVIIIAGDFNQLNTSFLEHHHGLVQMVNTATHCNHLIDKIFVSLPDVYSCDVYSSILKTKHSAVVLTCAPITRNPSRSKRKVQLYDMRAPNIDKLRYNLGVYPWGRLLHCNDIETLYEHFVNTVLTILAQSVPCKNVVLGTRDPDYITPLIKSLLRKRNRLRRCGHVERANQLAQKINILISQARSTSLSRLSNATTKDLWAAVNKTRKRCDDGNKDPTLLYNPNVVNDYFAKVASKAAYDSRELDGFRCEASSDSYQPLYNFEVERILSKIKLTAAGCDHIPAWLLRSCSYELADIVTAILNCSISTGKVPSYWLNAVVTPVPKVNKPVKLSDYRPISVTPHISRIAEKIIVRRWLQPAIPTENIEDQYAYKNTGSTTAALVHFVHRVTEMLEHNAYVRCLMIDFSKAFDSVDHVVLMSKVVQLNLPSFVVNWICSFLAGRGQQCKLNGELSMVANIGCSIVQGSGIGPTLYIVMGSDLHALSQLNDMCKYADDTTLLVPEHTDTDIDIEFNHVKSWALNNHLTLNLTKTKEIVFKRPRVRCFHLPPAIDNIEQLDSNKLLGILLQSNFKMDKHVLSILSQCTQRMYLLKLLKHQGMSQQQLSVIAHSIIVSRILYALPAWGGFLSVELKNKINAFFKRLKRFGYVDCVITIDDLIDRSDHELFKKVCAPNHSLYHLLPPYRSTDLRLRGHPFRLPEYCTDLHKKSFIVRTLYKYIK